MLSLVFFGAFQSAWGAMYASLYLMDGAFQSAWGNVNIYPVDFPL
ncbi:MAG: hypothetical protein ACTSU5_19100 [Promethearchaeota archaeon]